MAESADGARSVSLVHFVHISVVKVLFTTSSKVMEPQKNPIIVIPPLKRVDLSLWYEILPDARDQVRRALKNCKFISRLGYDCTDTKKSSDN